MLAAGRYIENWSYHVYREPHSLDCLLLLFCSAIQFLFWLVVHSMRSKFHSSIISFFSILFSSSLVWLFHSLLIASDKYSFNSMTQTNWILHRFSLECCLVQKWYYFLCQKYCVDATSNWTQLCCPIQNHNHMPNDKDIPFAMNVENPSECPSTHSRKNELRAAKKWEWIVIWKFQYSAWHLA